MCAVLKIRVQFHEADILFELARRGKGNLLLAVIKDTYSTYQWRALCALNTLSVQDLIAVIDPSIKPILLEFAKNTDPSKASEREQAIEILKKIGHPPSEIPHPSLS